MAVLEGLADHTEVGEVEHDPLLLLGGEVVGFQRGGGKGVPEAEGGARGADAMEDRGRLWEAGKGEGRAGARASILVDQSTDIFEGGDGERVSKRGIGGGGFAARDSTLCRPHQGETGEESIGRWRARAQEGRGEWKRKREKQRQHNIMGRVGPRPLWAVPGMVRGPDFSSIAR